MGFTTLQTATSTSTGTGTTKTQINGGSDLVIPAGVRYIYDAIPYQAATGAYTAAEGSAQLIELESVDIQPNISPKRINMCETNGGLGTFTNVIVGMLQTFPINVSCLGGNRLRVYGTSLVLNTVAFRVGCGFLESDQQANLEQLYWEATARTASGTAAARVAGADMTISAGKRLKKVYQHFYVGGTVTVSESFVGYGEFVSNGFVDAIPLTFPFQPSGLGLSASTPLKPGELLYNVDIGLRNPGTGQVTVNTFCNVEEANTASESFNSGCAYTR